MSLNREEIESLKPNMFTFYTGLQTQTKMEQKNMKIDSKDRYPV